MGNAPSAVPYGAQSNAINTQLVCSFHPTDDAFVNTRISLTAPLAGGAGQTVNITDINATARLPIEFVVSILDSGAASYNANVSITFDITNASPSVFTIHSDNNKHNVSYNAQFPDSNLDNNFPAPGTSTTGVLDPLGPITLGSIGQSDFRLKSVDFAIDIFGGNGNPLYPLPATINCIPTPEKILASIVVDDSPVQPLIAPANNAPLLAAPAFEHASTTASIPTVCTQDRFIPSDVIFNYTFAGTGPLIASNGQAFNLSNVNNFVTIPGSVAGGATALYNAGNCAIFVHLFGQNNLPGLGLSLTSASPQSIDVSNTFVASDSSTPNPLVTGRYISCGDGSAPVQFPFPNWGYLNLTDIVPTNATGSNFAVSFEIVEGDIQGYEIPNGLTGIERWICKPLQRSVLLSAPIM